MPRVSATPPKSSVYHYASEVPPRPHWCLYRVIKQIRFSFQTGRGSSCCCARASPCRQHLGLEGLPEPSDLLVELFALVDVRHTRGLVYSPAIPQPFSPLTPLCPSAFVYQLSLLSLQKISAKLGQRAQTLQVS